MSLCSCGTLHILLWCLRKTFIWQQFLSIVLRARFQYHVPPSVIAFENICGLMTLTLSDIDSFPFFWKKMHKASLAAHFCWLFYGFLIFLGFLLGWPMLCYRDLRVCGLCLGGSNTTWPLMHCTHLKTERLLIWPSTDCVELKWASTGLAKWETNQARKQGLDFLCGAACTALHCTAVKSSISPSLLFGHSEDVSRVMSQRAVEKRCRLKKVVNWQSSSKVCAICAAKYL